MQHIKLERDHWINDFIGCNKLDKSKLPWLVKVEIDSET